MVAENWNHEGLEGNGDVTSEEVTVKVFSWGAHEVHIRDSGVGGRESGGEQEPLLASVVNLLLGCLVGSWWTEPSEPVQVFAFMASASMSWTTILPVHKVLNISTPLVRVDHH